MSYATLEKAQRAWRGERGRVAIDYELADRSTHLELVKWDATDDTPARVQLIRYFTIGNYWQVSVDYST